MSSAIDISTFSGQDQATSIFSLYLPELIEEFPNIRILSSDMSYGARLDRFKALYPDKFINVGISEQNLIGIAAGISSEGYKCVALAQATFITMRCFEQARQYMSYMGIPLVLIGLSAGFSLQFMGNTHYAVEDIAIMRSVPGIDVLLPADSVEAVKAFDYAIRSRKPAYIRLLGNISRPTVYTEDFDYDPAVPTILKKGKDISVFAAGSLVSDTLEAAAIIENVTGASVKVIALHSANLFGKEAVKDAADSKLLVSVEEHYTIGGIGSAIADKLCDEPNCPVLLKLGVQEKYSSVGDYQFLLKQHRLTPDLIASDIISKYKSL